MTKFALSVFFLLSLCLSLSSCSKPEDPARVALRERLKQPGTMTVDEIGTLFDEVAKSMEGKTIKGVVNGTTRDFDAPQKEVVLGMISYRPGVFDEGIRTMNGRTLRVINAPGRPSNAELDAARHIMIDVETFLPYHFEFTSGVPADEFTLDFLVQ